MVSWPGYEHGREGGTRSASGRARDARSAFTRGHCPPPGNRGRQRREDATRVRATSCRGATITHAGCCRPSTLPKTGPCLPQEWQKDTMAKITRSDQFARSDIRIIFVTNRYSTSLTMRLGSCEAAHIMTTYARLITLSLHFGPGSREIRGGDIYDFTS